MKQKKDDKIKDIPIIMVTARGTDIDKKKGKALNVAEYLTKPFKTEDLERSVSKVLSDVKKKKEKEAISKYVAKDVLTNVDEVIDGVKDKEPEDKFITILFSDICSFTPKCEKLSPRAIVKLLNSYFDIMINVLQTNNAIIDKFIGDAIVARFDSGDKKKDALDAAKSACEMLNSLKEFNEDSLEPVEIRIGVNSGNVILGNIGCESYRLDYTMIGDNVNIGQRLESAAQKMGCLLSETTYNLIKDSANVGPTLALSLKGKKEKVNAYPLIEVL